VLTVAAFAGIVAAVLDQMSAGYDAEWVESVDAAVSAREATLRAALADPPALAAELAALAAELELRVALRSPDGELLAGDPEVRPARSRSPRQRARLGRGQPLVARGNLGPGLAIGLRDDAERLVGVLHFDTGDRSARRLRLQVLAVLGLLIVLGAGAWPLARSLTRRLAALEQGAGRIARGDLATRVPEGAGSDELDRLGRAFNAMAAQIEALLRSQRALLTNVSHELRTPVARMRVLAELLGERAQTLPDHPAAARLRRGMTELGDDLVELETLVGDLLTSGRLDLAGPHAPAIQRARVELAPLLARVGARVGARVACPPGLAVDGDALLLERLLANLLHNARRACPEGQVDLSARAAGDRVILAVEDEGPGIAPADRAVIFDPFTRLDAARARDHGGVGLGLYLCRQIVQAHGGTIAAEDREDGARGARLAVALPDAAAGRAPP
jgi:signal transduction histidine kinase